MNLPRLIRTFSGGILASSALIAGAMLPGATRALAGPETLPWTPGTVFVAAAGIRYDDGEVVALSPGGGSTPLYFGEPEDVAVDSSGDVFWPDCNTGAVYEYSPTLGESVVDDSLDCPEAVAVDPVTDSLLIGSFQSGENLLSHPLSGGADTVLLPGNAPQSIAVDGQGNIFYVAGSDQLFMLPAGSTTPVEVPIPVETQAVRLDASGDLFLATVFGDNVAEVDPSNPTTDTGFGTGLQYVDGSAVDAEGNVYAAAVNTDNVVEISGGAQTQLIGDLDYPRGLAVYPPIVPSARTSPSVSLETASPSTIYSGTSESFTAQVSAGGSPGSCYVQFEDNGYPFGSPMALDGTGSATLDAPPPGSVGADAADSISALYMGNSSTYPGLSNAAVVNVDQHSDTVTLAAPLTAVPQDKKVHVKVRVKGVHGQSIPTGSVDLLANGYVEASTTLSAGGSATFHVTLQPGDSTLQAQFVSDGATPYLDNPSNSIVVDAVAPYTASVDVDVNEGSMSGNKTPVSFDITIIGASGQPNPTGTIYISKIWTCSALVPDVSDSNSTTTCSALVPGTGSKVANVVYSGDSNYHKAKTIVDYELGGGDD